MNTIYLESSTLELRSSVDPSSTTTRPDATDIDHLRDAGHRVVLVTHDTLPDDATGWYVSDRAATLDASRGRSLRTMLVGPTGNGDGIQRPADVIVRDLRSAVLTILADEAMGEPDGQRPG